MDSVVRCPSCGQANRVPLLGSGQSAVCGKCKTALPAAPITVTDANFDSVIGSGAYLVDFWAGWCGPCRQVAPILDQLAAQRNDVRIAKLNVDENPGTAARFRVQSIPALLFFRDGVERGRIVGAVPQSQIEAGIRQYLG